MSEREEKFENMLYDIQHNYSDTVSKMKKLKAEINKDCCISPTYGR